MHGGTSQRSTFLNLEEAELLRVRCTVCLDSNRHLASSNPFCPSGAETPWGVLLAQGTFPRKSNILVIICSHSPCGEITSLQDRLYARAPYYKYDWTMNDTRHARCTMAPAAAGAPPVAATLTAADVPRPQSVCRGVGANVAPPVASPKAAGH